MQFVVHPKDSVYLETSFYNSFPSDYIETKALLAQKKGLKELTFKIQHPQKVELYYGDLTVQCFLIPNDTLEIHIKLDTTQNIKKGLKFIGKYAAINNFYKNKELHYNKTGALAPNSIGLSTQKTISEYSTIVDSLTQIELNYINSYKNKDLLPKWFIDYELSEIKCSTAGSKFSIVKYKRRFSKQEVNLPENYYSEIDSLMKDFKASKISSNYYIYLERKFQPLIISSFDTEDSLNWGEVYRQRNVEISLKYLDEEASDIFLTKRLNMFISRTNLVDSTYQLYYNAIKNQDFKTYLTQLKKEKGDVFKTRRKSSLIYVA